MTAARRALALALGMALFALAGSGPLGFAAGEPAAAGQGRGPGMMAGRGQMAAEMAARERRLDELVAKMQAATGAEKVDAVAAALAELVAQHKAMHRQMMGGAMDRPTAPPVAPVPAPRGETPETPDGTAHDDHHALAPDEMCLPDA